MVCTQLYLTYSKDYVFYIKLIYGDYAVIRFLESFISFSMLYNDITVTCDLCDYTVTGFMLLSYSVIVVIAITFF